MTAVGARKLEAASMGERASAIVEAGGLGRVLGVYTGAVNVSMPGGLVCVVPESSGRGPINLTLPLHGRPMSSFGLEVGDSAWAKGTTFDLGGKLFVSLAGAAPYSPRTRFSPILPPAELKRNLEAARRTGLGHGNLSGLGELLSGGGERLASSRLHRPGLFASAAAARVERLCDAVCSGDAWLTRRAVSDLIGLGPGLTPSSDDMLAGMALFMVLYSNSSGASSPGCEAAVRAVAREAVGRTTPLSEAYLTEAAAGRGNEAVLALCEAILTGGEQAVVRESRRLLKVGETSGTDTLLGVVIGGALCVGSDRHVGGRLPW